MIRRLINYSLKNVIVKTVFTITVFEILLFVGRSVLGPTQLVTGSKRVYHTNLYLKLKYDLLILSVVASKSFSEQNKDFLWVVFSLASFPIRPFRNNLQENNVPQNECNLVPQKHYSWQIYTVGPSISMNMLFDHAV